ncbi:MAG: glycoside hydrolase family 19 protein [Bacteroidales bacterium]|jgi:putative chitinase
MDLLKFALPKSVNTELDSVITKFSINTELRMAHFLSQCYHESGGFVFKTENLNYSEKGLLTVFGKYFNSTNAKLYARQPEKIGNLVYANRMGNGNVYTGDGYRYRGRGYIQLTGKDHYTKFNQFVKENVILNPDLVATTYPLLSAAWFWNTNKLNEIADWGSSDSVITSVTKKINGGTHGLANRISAFHRFYDKVK